MILLKGGRLRSRGLLEVSGSRPKEKPGCLGWQLRLGRAVELAPVAAGDEACCWRERRGARRLLARQGCGARLRLVSEQTCGDEPGHGAGEREKRHHAGLTFLDPTPP
jgi:hypothetical protein